MKNFVQEFKDFAVKGNAMDLAIGVVIGAAFGKIVESLVKDIITPLIGVLIGHTDFSALAWKGVMYGSFINSVVDFLIIGFSIFIVVKQLNRFKKDKPAAPTQA